ncbi:hypothetical protein EI171_29085 [Bradyrhizobium sp. LCT2]|uniref:hypothetical protein n=1 Tax=Bradyrhizobium sp. LCT2 TaxID=2493093 RepID=UPI0013745EE5|nr:hypothetical protein [Bradyrhizobium sp. LCT2]QHP70990.1 hypothetical protein EI171_29085 [Bradyrhizobium sp. LCT2]
MPIVLSPDFSLDTLGCVLDRSSAALAVFRKPLKAADRSRSGVITLGVFPRNDFSVARTHVPVADTEPVLECFALEIMSERHGFFSRDLAVANITPGEVAALILRIISINGHGRSSEMFGGWC